jgi:heme ABC exporter ATP-binding subunit CcmA
VLSVGPRSQGSFELRAVSRSFRGRRVLDGVSLRVEQGQIVAVVGTNGIGKTTLLRILAGLLAPDDGEVEVCDLPPGRGQVALMAAGDRGLHWRLSGSTNLAFFARIAGVAEGDVDDVVEGAATAVGAAGFLGRPVGECSTGQRRRLMIAQVLVTRAPVLLLDEPFADLDDEGIADVTQVVRGWGEAGGVVVAAAPRLDLAPASHSVLDLGRAGHPS